MIRAYFALEDDVYLRDRWYLNGLRDSTETQFDSREFRYGQMIEVGPPLQVSVWNDEQIVDVIPPLRVSWRREGKPLDFTYADDDMPVVTVKVAQMLVELVGPDIQRFPVQVDKMEEGYEIVNVISRVDCIDPERSEIEWWGEDDERPDKIGKPRMITKLVIDPSRVGDSHIFRPDGWGIVVIVSDVVKRAFEEAQVSGVRFKPVT